MATYIFKITPISTFNPNNLGITFPSNFFLDENELTIGLATSENSALFNVLTYDNIQKVVNNVSAVDGVSLKAYPSFTLEGNSVFMTNLSSYHSTS